MRESPRALIDRLESRPALPDGADERFSGYGVMGLPFRSGHVLALRRFPVSSIGPGYTSVWHRDPAGAWIFYATASPRQTCTRFFGAQVTRAAEAEIHLTWTDPFCLEIVIPAESFAWEVVVESTPATRIMNTAARALPAAAWRSPAVLTMMAGMAGPLLGVGRIGLQGAAPNGQRFIANPQLVWAVADSRAVIAGRDLGPPGPVHPQARLEDFWIPQRGILAIGQSYFEPFDAARHSTRVTSSG